MKTRKQLAILVCMLIIMIPMSLAVSISNIQAEPVDQHTEQITWETDKPADTKVEYSITPDLSRTKSSNLNTTTHSLNLTGLEPGQEYYYKVSSSFKDEFDSVLDKFTTFLVSNISIENITLDSAIIKWITNHPSTSLIRYGEDINQLNKSQSETLETTEHSIIINNLKKETTYYFLINKDTRIRNLKTKLDITPPVITLDQLNAATNQNILNISGLTEPNCTVIAYEFSETNAVLTNSNQEGRFTLDYELRNGLNQIKIKAIDISENKYTEYLNITLDTTPPEINIEIPESTNKATLNLIASVSKNIYLQTTINNNKVTAREVKEGNFNLTLSGFAQGENNITITATDIAGNKEIIKHTLSFDNQPPSFVKMDVPDEVHFQIATITGQLNEPGYVRIANLANVSNWPPYFNWTTGKYGFENVNEGYGAGIKGGAAPSVDTSTKIGGTFNLEQMMGKIEYAKDHKTVQTDANGNFEIKVALTALGTKTSQGRNTLWIMAGDKAGNEISPVKKDIKFDPGSEFWRVGESSLSPGYVVAGEVKKISIPLGLVFTINPVGFVRDPQKITNVRIDDVRTTGAQILHNNMIAVQKTDAHYNADRKEIFGYTELKLDKWSGNINDIPDPIEFELKLMIQYDYEGESQPMEHVYIKQTIDVDMPLEEGSWLSMNTINSLLKFINKSLDVLSSIVPIVRDTAMYTMGGCLLLTTWFNIKGYISRTPLTESERKLLFTVCDRVGCPYVPPECAKLEFKTRGKGENEIAYTDKYRDGSMSLYHTGQTGNDYKERNMCPADQYVVERTIQEKTYNYDATAGQQDLIWGGLIAGESRKTVVCTELTKKEFYKDLKNQETAPQLTGPRGCYLPGPSEYDDLKCLGIFDKRRMKDVNPFDDIWTSTNCVCISGMAKHLENLEKIFNAAKKCLLEAQQGEVSGGYCERLLSMYACDFISWGVMKVLENKRYDAEKTDPKNPQKRADGFNTRTQFQAVNKELGDRYQGVFNNRFGLSTDQVVKQVCMAAWNEDWTGLEDELTGMIETVPAEPTILPLMADSRVYRYNPFKGTVTIRYSVTPGVYSGGQPINWKLELYCEKGAHGDEYCPNRRVSDNKSGYIGADSQLTGNIEWNDEDANYWFNKARLTLTYSSGAEIKERILTTDIVHKGGMVKACGINTNPFGDNMIWCRAMQQSHYGSIKLDEVKLSPKNSEFYAGNDVKVKLKLKNSNFQDRYFFIAYDILRPGEEEPEKLIHVATPKTEDLFSQEDEVTLNVNLMKIGEDDTNQKQIYYVGKIKLSEDQKTKLQNSKDKFQIAAPTTQRITIKKIIFGGKTCSYKGETADCNIKENQIWDEIYVEAYAPKDKVPFSVDVIPYNEEGLDQTNKFNFIIDKEQTLDKKPKYPPGEYKLTLKLIKDLDNNEKPDPDDMVIPYGQDEQKEEIEFKIVEQEKIDCEKEPLVEIITPVSEVYCNPEKPLRIEVNTWDDCNQEELTVYLNRDEQEEPEPLLPDNSPSHEPGISNVGYVWDKQPLKKYFENDKKQLAIYAEVKDNKDKTRETTRLIYLRERSLDCSQKYASDIPKTEKDEEKTEETQPPSEE